MQAAEFGIFLLNTKMGTLALFLWPLMLILLISVFWSATSMVEAEASV